MSDEVTPTTPSEAVEWYLAKRDPELSEKSKQNHRYRLEQFLAFYSDNEIEDINRLMGRDIHRYGR